MRGIWRHYKGGKYRVLGIARDADTMKPMVVYAGHPVSVNKTGIWVRSYDVFMGRVQYKGKTVDRFKNVFKEADTVKSNE